MTPDTSTAFDHTCEVCGQVEHLTATQAFDAGWDYPPTMGMFGVISPRTCGSCQLVDTVWWQIMMDKTPAEQLSAQHCATVQRILAETAFE